MQQPKSIIMSVTNTETIVSLNLNYLVNDQLADFFQWQNFSFSANPHKPKRLVLSLFIPDYHEMSELLQTLKACMSLIPVGEFTKLKIKTNNVLAASITRGFAISNHLQWSKE